MGKHKNKLKDRVHYCFLCGRELNSTSEKIIHRINPRKQNKSYNVIILCSECKKQVLLKGIYYTDINTEILYKYFFNFSKECRHIVMRKVYEFLVKRE